LVGAGKMPNVEIRKVGSKGPVQEVYVQKERLDLGPSEGATQLDTDSLSNARRSLDSAFNLDPAEGHIGRSTEAEPDLNLYAYGVCISSIPPTPTPSLVLQLFICLLKVLPGLVLYFALFGMNCAVWLNIFTAFRYGTLK
jgi:hypothetical protein